MAGNIAKRSDGKWRARYRDAAGREHSRHFDRKLDATRWLASVEVARSRGEWVDPALTRIRLGDWATAWLAGQVQLKPSTLDRYMRLLRVQVLPTWDRVPLSAVTHADVSEWVSRLSASGLAPSTVRQAHRVLALVLDLAVRDGRLARNPAVGVRLPRVHRAEPVFLSHEQVDALAGACGDAGVLVRVLAYTGLRWGEAAALRVRRVDLLRRRLDVAESVTEVGGRAVTGTPKTHQRRSVPLPRSLVEPLASQLAGKGPEDLVFTAPGGGVLRNGNFRHRIFDPAAEEVGLAGLTPHDLRHTAASLAIAAGANVKAVQRMLGHASAAMTLDVYAGLFGDDLDAVADRLDAAAAASRTSRADSLRTAPTARADRGSVAELQQAR